MKLILFKSMIGLNRRNKKFAINSKIEVVINQPFDKNSVTFDGRATVVQRADKSIQQINRYPAGKMYWLEYILSAG